MAVPRTRREPPHPPRGTRKIAISLPAALLDEVERRRGMTGENRSRFVGQALERYLRDADGASRVREYVEGYRRMPESPEEVAEADATSGDALDEEPWE